MNALDPETRGASLYSLSVHRLLKSQATDHPCRREVVPGESVFRVGRNACAVASASRAAPLVDAHIFFKACAEALAKAERQVFILGWDTDSRTDMPSPQGFPGLSISLLGLLDETVKRRPHLQIYVLSWDFAFIYLFEREALPRIKFAGHGQGRIHFQLDRTHPSMASHHQKIVVIDDRVAFNGGLDLTQRRWDTPEHKGYDPRRIDPGGHLYGPFHDVQMVVSGDAAKTLGDLARDRWQRATGEKIAPPQMEQNIEAGAGDPWPVSVRPWMRDVDVAISRTLPMGLANDDDGRPSRPVNEVERLFLDTIHRAQAYVYIENQYFTSTLIAKAIAKRLREPDGPEFIMVLPRDQTGWIESATMGLLRSRALRIVEAADIYGRWRAYYPVVPNLEQGYVKVHSKVMIADDLFLRIGSANLNGRSMGLDTECDLAIEAGLREDVRVAFAKLRRDLLGEHLGVESAEFEARFLVNGSLIDTVESFRGGERTLMELRPSVPEWVGNVAPPKEWIDPSGPKGIRRWFAHRWSEPRHRANIYRAAALMVTIAGFLGIFASGALDEWLALDGDKVAAVLAEVRDQSWIEPAIILGIAVGSFLLVPLTVMWVGIALVFSPWKAVVLAGSGSLLAATLSFLVGWFWAGDHERLLKRPSVVRISERLKSGGVWAVTAIRLAPGAPYHVIGLTAGVLRVGFYDYVLGSFFALLPGLAAIALAQTDDRLVSRAGSILENLWLFFMTGFILVTAPRAWRWWRRAA